MISSLLRILAVYPSPPTCPNNSFFGLVPWYHYLPSVDFVTPTGAIGCTVTNFTFLSTSGAGDIPLILLAVVDDLLHVAGIVAVSFVVYGGFQYVSSQGQPDKTARAQNTITDALVGLAVAVIAIVAVSFLANKLGG